MTTSLHHEHGDTCPLCEQKLSVAHPTLKESFGWIKKSFPDCHISWAFRNESDQNAFFFLGKTKEKWPNSKHNNMKDGLPLPLALDLFQLVGGDAYFHRDYYERIYSFVKEQGLALEWSGNWQNFMEYCHFQLK